jgi:hypothetical protein
MRLGLRSKREPDPLRGSSLHGGYAAASRGVGLEDAQGQREQHLGGAAARAQQLGALVLVAVGTRRDLEHHVAVTDDTAQFAFSHGWLLFVGRWNSPDVLTTLPRDVLRAW